VEFGIVYLQGKVVGGIMVLPNVGTTWHEVTNTFLSGKGKGAFVPVFVMRAYRGSGGMTTLLLNLDIKWCWVVSLMPLLLYCLLLPGPEKEPLYPWIGGWMDPRTGLAAFGEG